MITPNAGPDDDEEARAPAAERMRTLARLGQGERSDRRPMVGGLVRLRVPAGVRAWERTPRP